MSLTEDLVPVLKKLRLSGLFETLDLRRQQALDDEHEYLEFLYRVLHDEVERREAKQLGLRLRRASFESDKTIESFDFRFNPSVPKTKVLDLANCTFIERKENVLFVGPTGVGKSHLAQALGHRACRAGFKVVFVSAQKMLKEMRASRGDGSYERRLLRFTGPDVLIFDDLGLRTLRQDEPLDLYEVIRGRYERGAAIVTSNRDATELGALFACQCCDGSTAPSRSRIRH